MTDKEKDLLIDEAVMNEAVANAQKPTYAGTFDSQLEDIYHQLENRPKFSYDINEDPFYDMYKDKYIQQGKLAMKDTMGQAAALTGGYGNTYGQQVGQQAYDAYLQNLSDVIPNLYSMAYGMYQDEGDSLKDRYGMLGDLRDTEYGRYRDAMSDYNYEQEVAREKEETEYNRRINEENTAYSRQQQAYSNLYALIKASGYIPTDAELAAAGMTRAAADALAAEYTRSITPTATGGSSGSSGSSGRSSGSSGSSSSYAGSGAPDWWYAMSDAERKQLQRDIGTDADGIWGPNTAAAYANYYGGTTYQPSGDNGYNYSLNGYTGEKIYTNLLEEAQQAKLEDELVNTYVNTKKSSGPTKKSSSTHTR